MTTRKTAAVEEQRGSRDSTRVLVYCRPYLISDFRENVEPLLSEFEFSFLTDGRCPGTRDTRECFYRHLREKTLCEALTTEELDDIRDRCRLLNKIDRTQANALVHAMSNALSEELDKMRPDVILSQLVDEYTTHIVALLAQKRGIKMINYFPAYVPDYTRLTEGAYGIAFDVREPDDEEVERVHDSMMRSRFRQNYLQRRNSTFGQHAYSVGRYMVKRAAFAVKAIVERDPWNVHYALTPYIAERRSLSDFPTAREFDADWQQALSIVKKRRKGPIVYLPLSYMPESTTNYWIENRKIIDYDNMLVNIVEALVADPGVIVVVKEHTHMMGARGNALYRRLKSIPNVINVHPEEISQDVMAASDAVVLGTGSTGIEATMASTPLFVYADENFWYKECAATYLDLDNIASWAEKIRLAISQDASEKSSDHHDFVRAMLRSYVRTRGFGQKWPLIAAEDLRLAIVRAAERRVR